MSKPRKPERERLPAERRGVTRRFRVPDPTSAEGYLRVYVTTGQYEDGRLGEVFIKADKVGSLASGAFDAVAMVMSIALQHGVPLKSITGKLAGMRFEPAGRTGEEDERFRSCTSVLDLVARWLEATFGEVAP